MLRKLENDQTITAVEKTALREVGGESGAILAVEMAEDNGAVELEEFVVSGKSKVMVMKIYRIRLARELPETDTAQRQNLLELTSFAQNKPAFRSSGSGDGVEETNSSVFGMGGAMLRPATSEM